MITANRAAELLQKLLLVLKDSPEPMPPREAIEMVRRQVTLSDFEQSKTEKGTDRFYNILSFATIPLKKIGWLDSKNFRWTLTGAGLEALKQYPDSMQFRGEANRQYNAWRRAAKVFREAGIVEPEPPTDEDAPEPAEISSETLDKEANSPKAFYEEVCDRTGQDLAAYIGNMPPFEFQLLIGDLLKAMGYYIRWGEENTGGADGGLDLVVNKDPLGMEYPRVKVQAKRQQRQITLDNMKAFAHNLKDCDSGIYVCIGGFSGEASKCAREASRPISTFDLEDFLNLWCKFYDKLDEAAHRRLPLKPVYMRVPQSE